MLPHYSPFKVAETFSLLAGLFPGRIDLGARARRGHRPADDLRAAARPPHGRARRLPRSSSPSCSPTSMTRCPHDHPFARLAATLPGRARAPGAVAARLLAAERASGRPSWACPTRSPTSSTPSGAEIAALYRERFAARTASCRPPTRRSPCGCCAPTSRRGGAVPRREQPDGRSTLLRRGELIAVPPPEKAVAFLEREGKPAGGCATRTPRGSSARRRRSARSSSNSRASTGRRR